MISEDREKTTEREKWERIKDVYPGDSNLLVVDVLEREIK